MGQGALASVVSQTALSPGRPQIPFYAFCSQVISSPLFHSHKKPGWMTAFSRLSFWLRVSTSSVLACLLLPTLTSRGAIPGEVPFSFGLQGSRGKSVICKSTFLI